MRSLPIASVAAIALASAANAQPPGPPETAPAKFSISKEYRAIQLSALGSQRRLLLKFADSMPERLYRDKVTPAQRDFAQQIQHVAGSGAFVATLFATGKPPAGPPPDTAKILNSRAALKQYVNDQYDMLQKMMTDQTDADRDLQVKFFGGQFIPKWQVWDELNQHAAWTTGQVVANFRKHGMAPPSFLFF